MNNISPPLSDLPYDLAVGRRVAHAAIERLEPAPTGSGLDRFWKGLLIAGGGVVLGFLVFRAFRERAPVTTVAPTISPLPAPSTLDIVRAKYPEFGL